LETQPLRGHLLNTAAPKRLRPFFLHRWVGETIAARLAWLALHPGAVEYRFGNELEPCCEEVAWQHYPGRVLRKLSEERLLPDPSSPGTNWLRARISSLIWRAVGS
jgi:hypothetical protein